MKPIIVFVFFMIAGILNAATGNANDGELFAGLIILLTVLPLVIYFGAKLLVKACKEFLFHNNHHSETN